MGTVFGNALVSPTAMFAMFTERLELAAISRKHNFSAKKSVSR